MRTLRSQTLEHEGYEIPISNQCYDESAMKSGANLRPAHPSVLSDNAPKRTSQLQVEASVLFTPDPPAATSTTSV